MCIQWRSPPCNARLARRTTSLLPWLCVASFPGRSAPQGVRFSGPGSLLAYYGVQCDGVIELGLGAGEEGGRVVAEGPPAVVARSPESRTAPYLARELG